MISQPQHGDPEEGSKERGGYVQTDIARPTCHKRTPISCLQGRSSLSVAQALLICGADRLGGLTSFFTLLSHILLFPALPLSAGLDDTRYSMS